ncbi:ABC transporter substrate-binding protein [Thalassobacter stenotrophicus]|uniref:Leucine-, isoleucine-, valine-, threonine-, and alanine-binding protein n=2 Tax=Thalassobacter stenotrophicus TaxID=266809 RepID=A0A0P1EWY4_9RHOB|nr:ABC transporter substrate-binding protein [Thalassobacter stenotrophicus]CUH59556.1 Leucine-, isoleucine-, valine-, threonine-, and alanine-binding protein precursor [Thalassobacter stenotrophicus]SHI80892.1 amino acid/amide ABC transporter substrate-binding protein, HAAT family [Thalassobacter stenotrophicus DSM 16310]
MKKVLLASVAAALMTGGAMADGHGAIKLGVSLGFTGPLESLAPAMAGGAELAMGEVNAAGGILDGKMFEAVQGDSTCIDASAATSVAERLVTSDGVAGIVGAMCSGATGAILANVAVPNGIVMVSPSATSPGLTTAEDNGLFFRTAPSDARQGVIISEILAENGITNVAVSYTNNDYGKGLADAFESAFEAAGGTVTINAAHEDNKADYSAEVGALAAAGGEVLVVAGYVDSGGSGIVRAALDTGAFDTFYFPDGMVSEQLGLNFPGEIDGSFGANPGTDSNGAQLYQDMATAGGFDGTSPFSAESYDAAALIMLAMQAAGSADPADYKDTLMDVANAPGEVILPGELAKAIQILKDGGGVDYSGASAVELIGPGEAGGNYRQITFENGELVVVGYR